MKEEKYIKDKLTNYDSPMDMDVMWAGLEKSLDSNEDNKPVFWLFKYGKKLFFIGLAMLLSIAAFTYLSDSKLYETTTSENLTTKTKTKTNHITEATTLTKNKEILSEEINTESRQKSNTSKLLTNKETPTQSTVNTTALAKQNRQTKQDLKAIKEDQSTLSSTVKHSNTKKKLTSSVSTSTRNNKAKTQNTTVDKGKKNAQLQAASSTQATNSQARTATNIPSEKLPAENRLKLFIPILPVNELQNLEYTKSLPVTKSLVEQPKANKTIIKQQPKKWRAGIGLAQTASFMKHQRYPIDSQILESLSLSPSWSATNNLSIGLSLKRIAQNGISFSSGLNYINHGAIYSDVEESPLEEQERVQNIVYVDNQNNFLGNGEQIITVERIRTKAYQQYKKLHTLQVPLLLGYELQRNRIDLSLSAGTAINYFFAQSSIDIEQLYDLVEYELPAFKISAQLKVELGYQLKERWRVYAAIEGGQILGKLNNYLLGREYFFDVSLKYAGIKTGVSYNF